ncbi:hypothetical protein HMPREF9398_1697 [Streptococcus sanguinis VMC66]|nr:hypothetical protein HMPREF9398_1697 [Streptococcus sanguinis VMC66]
MNKQRKSWNISSSFCSVVRRKVLTERDMNAFHNKEKRSH